MLALVGWVLQSLSGRGMSPRPEGLAASQRAAFDKYYCTQVQVIPWHESWDKVVDGMAALAIRHAVIRARKIHADTTKDNRGCG
jgi:hypothetical protein